MSKGNGKGYSPGIPLSPKGKGNSKGQGKPYPTAHYTYDGVVDDGWEWHPSYAFLTDEYDYEELEVDPFGLDQKKKKKRPLGHSGHWRGVVALL